MGDRLEGSKQPSRREMLVALGAATAGIGLSGCGIVTSSNSSGPAVPSAKISFPKKSKVKLPTGPVTFSWLDSDDLKGPYEKAVFAAYQKAHPNITIKYDGTSQAQINQIVPLGVRNGDPPDVFARPGQVPVQVMVNEGWVAPIDDLIPDFQAWKANYPSTTFVNGVNVFNGHVYTWQSSSPNYSFLLLYDVQYLHQAGYDPSKHRFTWSSLREACKKITARGKGQYYGLMTNGNQLGNLVTELAQLAGAHGGQYNWKTGTYNYTTPEFQGAFELLLSMKSDGSIFPGFLSLGDADSRARMPQRLAGMIFDGPWDIQGWPQSAPSYNFGVAMPPTGDDGRSNPSSYAPVTSSGFYVSATSKYKEIAGDLLSYMGSVKGQAQKLILSGGNLGSEIPMANQQGERSKVLSAKARTGIDITTKLLRSEPMPQARNADEGQVILAQKPLKPNIQDVAQGIMSGQITDVKGALKSLQDRSEQNLDDAIKAAQAKGAKVSRQDWVFPNWNPDVDYTQKDYKQLR